MVSDLPFGFTPSDPDDSDEPAPDVNPLAAMFGAGNLASADLGAALQRFGQLLSTSSGPVHWELARDTARQVVAHDGDRSVSTLDRAAVTEAVDVAQIWLDEATALPPRSTNVLAWSRAEWVEESLPRWKSVITPLAERMAAATAESLPTQIPEEMRALAGPMLGMVGQMSGVMFGGQVGHGLAALAREVLTSTEVGLRLAPAGAMALLPRNIGDFADGLAIPADQVRIFLALRECAHTRLFDHAPWLTARIENAVDEYARGTTVDVSGLQQALGGVDPSNPEALAELMSAGVFEPPTTPEQQAALTRLEVLLALVEGWVDAVTAAAADGRLPAAAALAESMRRRRASGGPAERTFETLVGLQLRPRRLREASTLWRTIAEHRGLTGRDGCWDHPDLLPDAAALEDPHTFVAGTGEGDWDIRTIDDSEPPSTGNSDDDPSSQ